jgi:hypothetical protein
MTLPNDQDLNALYTCTPANGVVQTAVIDIQSKLQVQFCEGWIPNGPNHLPTWHIRAWCPVDA